MCCVLCAAPTEQAASRFQLVPQIGALESSDVFVSRALFLYAAPTRVSCKYGVSEIMSIDVILVNARSLQRSQPPKAVITNVICGCMGYMRIVLYCVFLGCGLCWRFFDGDGGAHRAKRRRVGRVE